MKWPFTVQINWSSFSRSKEHFSLSIGQNNFGNKVLFYISIFFSEDEETNTCVISINDEKGQRQNANRKSICTFCLSEVKKKKTVLFKKTCQNTESSAGVTTEQGNLFKGIDKKTSKREVIEPIKRAFPRFSSQQHTFCKETKCSDFFYIHTLKYSRLRCLLHLKGLVICFYLGWAVFFSSDKI